LKLSINNLSHMYFEKNIPLTKSIVNDVIFAEKPYEMGIIQILIRE
jgi:hypothetical protein